MCGAIIMVVLKEACDPVIRRHRIVLSNLMPYTSDLRYVSRYNLRTGSVFVEWDISHIIPRNVQFYTGPARDAYPLYPRAAQQCGLTITVSQAGTHEFVKFEVVGHYHMWTCLIGC